MTDLYFDAVTLHRDGVRSEGLFRSFADLGLGSREKVILSARELTVEGAPGDRDLMLSADTLIANQPLHFVDAGTLPRVEIFALAIKGALSVRCQGRTGTTGAAGTRGVDAVYGWEFMVPDDDGPVVKPIRIRVLKKKATGGGPGGAGGNGGAGGFVRIWYHTATTTPVAAAPGGVAGKGGPGGAGGQGGKDGEGQTSPNGPTGPAGSAGQAGPPGSAVVTRLGTPAELFAKQAGQSGGGSLGWAAYRLKVAEFHYRRGGPADLTAARTHLQLIADRPGTATTQPRARRLLQQLWEGTLFNGLPRDVDVTPDVTFVGQDNQALYQTALTLLGHAHTIAGTATVQGTFASAVRLAADQGAITAAAAGTRIDEAAEHLRTAMSDTDLAQSRVSALDAKIKEINDAIAAEDDPGVGFLDIVTKVAMVGAAVAGVATGIGAGVAAVAAIGSGFAVLSKTAGEAKTMYDLVHDVKQKLDSKDMKHFKTSFNDIADAGKSIFHLGAMVDELSQLGANHPHPKLRELATAQRERVLLLKEVALHRQMEKEAQLGITAATAERDAVLANAALASGFADKLKNEIAQQSDPILRTLITSVRQLMDLLSARFFSTVRAKEIYLGLDPVEPVRFDRGFLHPDRERMLSPVDQVREIGAAVPADAARIIEWSSLVDQMSTPGLSLSPVPFWFSTEDPEHLEQFRSSRFFGFRIPVRDLFEEDGSQIYETKFDGITVLLHGATVTGQQSIRLRLLGRWSFRRRPSAPSPNGQIVDFALPYQEVHLTARQQDKAVQAELAPPANPRAQPPNAIWGRGIAGEWELHDRNIDLSGLTKVEIGFATQALSGSQLRAAAGSEPRLLRPLPGWTGQQPVPSTRKPTPVPARGWSTYGYSGGVTAVGARLI